MFCKKSVLRNFANFTYVCARVSFLLKLPATLLKKRLWHRCFLWILQNFLRNLFLQNRTPRWLLLYNLTREIIHWFSYKTIISMLFDIILIIISWDCWHQRKTALFLTSSHWKLIKKQKSVILQLDKIWKRNRACRNVNIFEIYVVKDCCERLSFQYKSRNMVKTSESNLREEERLAKEVRKFPCLYDKGNEDYKEKDRKKNAWLAVENALGYDEGTQFKL